MGEYGAPSVVLGAPSLWYLDTLPPPAPSFIFEHITQVGPYVVHDPSASALEGWMPDMNLYICLPVCWELQWTACRGLTMSTRTVQCARAEQHRVFAGFSEP